MGSTWESLLKALSDCIHSNEYRNDPDHDRARRDNLEFVVMMMLEKLRDAEHR